MTRTAEEVAVLQASDRVPTPSTIVSFDPPITIEELMLRLHRPGMSDARYPIRLEARLEVRCTSNPEDRAAGLEDLQTDFHGDLIEMTRPGEEFRRTMLARVTFNADMTVKWIEPHTSAPYFAVKRLIVLATTPRS